MEKAIRKDLMLHAYMFMQAGIPMIYSGDEIGQVNDYTYKEDPDKCSDSDTSTEELSSGKENRNDKDTVEGQIFATLDYMEKLRAQEDILGPEAEVNTWETGDQEILCMIRRWNGRTLTGIFNFADRSKEFCLPQEGPQRELLAVK